MFTFGEDAGDEEGEGDGCHGVDEQEDEDEGWGCML